MSRESGLTKSLSWRFGLFVIGIIIFYAIVSCIFVKSVLPNYGTTIWSIIYVLILYIGLGFFFWIIYPYIRFGVHNKKELSSILFFIILALSIAILLTVDSEYIPVRYYTHNNSTNGMSISVDVPSPFLIPAKYLKQDMSGEIRVTIYKYQNDIEIESVKLLSPIDSSISLNQHELKEIQRSTNKLVYTGSISAKHSGEIINKTGNYQIDVTYSGLLDKTSSFPSGDSDCDNLLPIQGVNSSRPDDSRINASDAVDMRNNTRWAEQAPAWITFDLGSQHRICTLKILWYKENINDQRVYAFSISVSNNSNGFTNIFSGRSDAVSKSSEEYNVRDITARYVNLTSIGSSTKEWVSINEAAIFGTSDPLSINSTKNEVPGSASSNLSSSNPNSDSEDGTKIYHALVTFPWNVRNLDLSLPTYFWIVMVGVVASRFLDFILSKLKTEDYIKEKIGAEMKNYINSISEGENEINNSKNKINKLRKEISWARDIIVEDLHLRDILWIVFSFILAVLVFASFKQNVTLIDSVLINISVAFAFGFTFDRTLEMATRFKSIYATDLSENQNGLVKDGKENNNSAVKLDSESDTKNEGEQQNQVSTKNVSKTEHIEGEETEKL